MTATPRKHIVGYYWNGTAHCVACTSRAHRNGVLYSHGAAVGAAYRDSNGLPTDLEFGEAQPRPYTAADLASGAIPPNPISLPELVAVVREGHRSYTSCGECGAVLAPAVPVVVEYADEDLVTDESDPWLTFDDRVAVGDVGFLLSDYDVMSRKRGRRRYSLSGGPGVTNLGGRAILDGWLGTTNDLSRSAHGVVRVVRVRGNGGQAMVVQLRGDELGQFLRRAGEDEMARAVEARFAAVALGRRTSPAKAAAARANGQRGGRPRNPRD